MRRAFTDAPAFEISALLSLLSVLAQMQSLYYNIYTPFVNKNFNKSMVF